MAFSRASVLRSCLRAARPTAARPQFFRQIARRGYASGGHGSAKAGGDAVWAAGAVAVTVPSCWFLLQSGPDESHGHEDHSDAHGKSHGKSHGEEELKDEEKPEEPEEKSEGEEKDSEDDEKSEASSSNDESEGANTPDTSDDDGNEHKSVPDPKGSKKRVESTKATKQGEEQKTYGDELKEPKDKPTASKTPVDQDLQSGKQEGLPNTDTKQSTDFTGSSEKSKKGSVDSGKTEKKEQ